MKKTNQHTNIWKCKTQSVSPPMNKDGERSAFSRSGMTAHSVLNICRHGWLKGGCYANSNLTSTQALIGQAQRLCLDCRKRPGHGPWKRLRMNWLHRRKNMHSLPDAYSTLRQLNISAIVKNGQECLDNTLDIIQSMRCLWLSPRKGYISEWRPRQLRSLLLPSYPTLRG